jgi:hypothetical protein
MRFSVAIVALISMWSMIPAFIPTSAHACECAQGNGCQKDSSGGSCAAR